ncbi:unnamed protein product [Withania somnifera]
MEHVNQNKLFCGGFRRDTTEQKLKEHFSKYGYVLSSVIAKDPYTATPRRFAFVSFSDPFAVEKALQDTHESLGQMVEVKKLRPKSEQRQSRWSSCLNMNGRTSGSNKIFVGGLAANLTEQDFKSYFEGFGRIIDAVVMHDTVTHRPRGFGFITFDSEDAVDKVTQKNIHKLSGKLVDVKRAIPKDGNNHSDNVYHATVHTGSVPYSIPKVDCYENLGASYSPENAYACYYGHYGYSYGIGVLGNGYPLGFGYGSINPLIPGVIWAINPALAVIAGSPMTYNNLDAIYSP